MLKIAISGDCLSVFTSAYPVRGMLLELIRQRKNDLFVIFYTKRARPNTLNSFFKELHALPNVKIQYFKQNRYIVGLLRFFTLSNYFPIDKTFDLFLNPSYLEYIRGFKGYQISNVTDLSILHSQASIPHSTIWKWQNKFAKAFYFNQKRLQVVSISHYTKQDIYRSFKHVNCNIKVIYNGIDNFWLDDKYINNSITEKYKNDSYFIWWGYISRRKNLLNLIAAYKLALDEHIKLPKLMIIGNIAPHMFQSIHSLLKDKNLIYLPFQDEYTLKTLVYRSHGLLFPSNYEGFGLPVIEAFSQGIPVACSNVTSLPEVAGGKALLFSPSNIDEIKDAIIKLSEPIADDYRKGLVIYARNFTYRKAALAYDKLIKHLI